MMSRLISRKLWIAVGSSIAMLASALLGIELDTEQVTAITAIVAAYLLGQSWVDGKK